MKKTIVLSLLGTIALMIAGCNSNTTIVHTENNTTEEPSTYSDCTVNGNTILAGEGETCKYEEWEVSCKDDRVSIKKDGSTLSGESVDLNGKIYTCK